MSGIWSLMGKSGVKLKYLSVAFVIWFGDIPLG